MGLFDQFFGWARPDSPYLTPEAVPDPPRYPIEKDIVTLGRGPDNTIPIEATLVSKTHCLITRTPAGWKIVDLFSTNGTFVNGQQVKEAVLQSGDHIRIGPVSFQYHEPGAVPRALVEPHPHAGFRSQLVEELLRTPWFLTSVFIHLVLYIVFRDFPITTTVAARVRPVHTMTATVEESNLVDSAEPMAEPTTSSGEGEEIPEPTESGSEESRVVEGPDELVLPGPDLGSQVLGLGEGSGGAAGGGGAGLGDLGLSEREFFTTQLGQRVRDIRAKGMDLVLLFDSTGSMEGVLKQAKDRMIRMITVLEALVPGFRLSVITFRDREDADYVVRSIPLSHDHYAALCFLESVHAGGGGDMEEAVEVGLQAAVRQSSWNKGGHKVIVLFGDAPPHQEDVPQALDLIRGFRATGGTFHAVFTVKDAQENFLNREDQATVKIFERFAREGRGLVAFLQREEAVTARILTLTVGQEFGGDLERILERPEVGWRARVIQRKVKEGDASWLLHRLKDPAVHPLVVQGLIELNHPGALPILTGMTTDPKLPPITRSAARYILLRLGQPDPSPPEAETVVPGAPPPHRRPGSGRGR
jgi:Mg-chelatase subunit ChlD